MQCLRLNRFELRKVNSNKKKKKECKLVFSIGQDFDYSKIITAFQFDMEKMIKDPMKFVMDAGFRLAARRRFNVQLDHDISREGFIMLGEGESLVRLGSSLNNFSNIITLKNFVHYITFVLTFSAFIRQGLKSCPISQESTFFEFRKYDVFIEEAAEQESFMEVVAEVDIVPIFITNGKVLFVRALDFLLNFGEPQGLLPRICLRSKIMP
jgi:hypothetical protein